MTKFDPHKHEQNYRRWKANGMQFHGLTDANIAIIRAYLQDMEVGANVSPASTRGARTYGRLRNMKAKLQSLAYILQEELEMTSWTLLEDKDRELLMLAKRMRDGEIHTRMNKTKPLRAVGTYVKALKAFWHWYQRVERKKGRDVKDITIDLDARDEKPKFCYFTIEDVKKMCDVAKREYRVLMMFLFDTGIRAPTELMNVRVSDLEWNPKTNHYTLNIREETSKTFGRKIKLLLCSEILQSYLETEKFGKDDYIFKKTPQRANIYLKLLASNVLGIGKRTGRTTVENGISMYDFRHASACYWLMRYKSESALKYRFGWKKSEMIHYYTELLGMKDTIEDDDLYIDITKTELEQQIALNGREITLLQEQLQKQDEQMQGMMDVIKALQLEKMLEQQIQNM